MTGPVHEILIREGTPGEAIEQAWACEIDRRVHRLEAEGSRGRDWHEVRSRIEMKLRSKLTGGARNHA